MITRRQVIEAMTYMAGMGGVGSALAAPSEKTMLSSKGFWFPDEADPHERTFMQWPVNRRVHPDSVFLEMLQQSIAEIANTVSEFEPVVMLMAKKFETAARRKLGNKVEIWDVPTDDLWCRDSGPLFVRNRAGELAVRSLNFNGWGNKQVHEHDGRIVERVADRLGLPVLNNGLVGEPGGVESDGAGTLIAHESSWVNPNRNTASKEDIERLLLDAYGAETVIWAPGIAGADITDYHIDALARFVAPGHVAIQLPGEVDAQDPWAVAARETFGILRTANDASGQRLHLTEIGEPTETRVASADFVAAYVNYYVCNGAVICAQFGDREADQNAQSKLSALYPGRDVITLSVDPLGETGGGIHCATQQQPKV